MGLSNPVRPPVDVALAVADRHYLRSGNLLGGWSGMDDTTMLKRA